MVFHLVGLIKFHQVVFAQNGVSPFIGWSFIWLGLLSFVRVVFVQNGLSPFIGWSFIWLGLLSFIRVVFVQGFQCIVRQKFSVRGEMTRCTETGLRCEMPADVETCLLSVEKRVCD